jgi:hypothetical protein
MTQTWFEGEYLIRQQFAGRPRPTRTHPRPLRRRVERVHGAR